MSIKRTTWNWEGFKLVAARQPKRKRGSCQRRWQCRYNLWESRFKVEASRDILCSWVLFARSTYIANFPVVRRQFAAFDLWQFLFLWKLFQGKFGKFGTIWSAKRMHIPKQLSHFRHRRSSVLRSQDASKCDNQNIFVSQTRLDCSTENALTNKGQF